MEQSSVKQKFPVNIFCHNKKGGDFEKNVRHSSSLSFYKDKILTSNKNQRRKKNQECTILEYLEVNEIDLDAKVLNYNLLCINFRCSEKVSSIHLKSL